MKFILTVFIALSFQPTLFSQDTYFLNKIETILIPDSIYIGEISFLDIYNENIMITDNLLKQVILFSPKNNWVKLNPVKCHPGLNFSPIESHFDDNGNIFVSNSGIWGLRFTKEGNCLGASHEKFRAPQRFDINNDIVGLTNDIKKSYVAGWENDGKPLSFYFSFNNKHSNADYRLSLGGVVEDNSNIFAINSLEPILYKFNKSKKTLNKREFKHPSYSELQNDLTEEVGSMKFMQEGQKLLDNNSMNYNLFSLNDNHLLLVVRKAAKKERRFDYHCYIFDKSSLELTSHFVVDTKVLYVGENKLIQLRREVINEENENVFLDFYSINLTNK